MCHWKPPPSPPRSHQAAHSLAFSLSTTHQSCFLRTELCLEFFPDSFRVCSHIHPKNDIIHCGCGYGVVVSLRQCISRNAHSPKNHVNHTVTASMQPITRRLSLCVCVISYAFFSNFMLRCERDTAGDRYLHAIILLRMCVDHNGRANVK